MTMLRTSARSPGRTTYYDNEEGMRFLRPEEHHLTNGKNGKSSRIFSDSFDRSPLTWKNVGCVILALLFVKVAIRYEVYRLPRVPDPESLGVAKGSLYKILLDTDDFVTGRARMFLHRITSFGVRMAGTLASDENTVQFLVGVLDDLRKELKDDSHHKLSFVADHVSGFFDLAFLSGYTSVYANVSNVLARLDPVGGDTKNALLLNCHFDSYFETVGASDDAVSCAIMLEVLRALMSSPTPLKHSVIFLFNGAEENILQASNGFVAGASAASGYAEGVGHAWSKDVRAFINMEAAGSGGREIMFQTGPGPAAPILVRAYAEVPYPFASVLGQEVFQSGIIPSDTDFRVFRDNGHLPGVDFAFYTNGYTYHTKYDTFERIPEGSIQHAGANILAIVRTLANSDLSTMPKVISADDHSGEKLVYFDIFSSIFILFSFRTLGLLFNFMAVGGTILRIYSLTAKCRQRDGSSYRQMLFSGIVAHCQSLVAVAITLFLIAYFMSASSSCMCWYSRPWLLIPIYVLPAASVSFMLHAAYFKYSMIQKCTASNFAQNCERIYDVTFDSALAIGSFGIVLLSLFGIASSYILCIWVGIPVLGAFILDRCVPLGTATNHRNSGNILLLRHAVLTAVPTIYHIYITDGIYEIFIPILSRTGVHVNPEYFMAVLIFIGISILLLFHGPVVYLSGGYIQTTMQIITGICGFILVTVLLTPLGDPYSMDDSRVDGIHVQRSVSQLTMQRMVKSWGNEAKAPVRSGVWFVPLDFNGISPLRGYSRRLDKHLANAELACTSDEDPKDKPYCGLPYFFPVTAFVGGKTWWMDVEMSQETVAESYWPVISQMPTSPKLISAGRWLAQYRVDCGDTPQCSLYISPHSHAALLSWHFSSEHYSINNFPIEKLVAPPSPTDKEPRDTWFVMLRFGSSSAETRLNQRTLIVTLEIGASGLAAASGVDLMDFAIVSHYFRGSSQKDLREMPSELRSFTTALPPWHFTIPVTSLYSNYAF